MPQSAIDDTDMLVVGGFAIILWHKGLVVVFGCIWLYLRCAQEDRMGNIVFIFYIGIPLSPS